MMGSTERKEPKARARVEEVLRALKKQAPLTAEQERFCSDACVDRFLRAKGDSVKKAAKHLRTVLSWRESIGTEFLLADEFSAELGDGMAYVAGHDDEARPVLVQYAPPTTPPPPHHHHHHLPTLLLLTNVPSLQVFRIKQDDLKLRSHKSFVRLLVFTLEVAISTMARLVDQLVLLFDASKLINSATLTAPFSVINHTRARSPKPHRSRMSIAAEIPYVSEVPHLSSSSHPVSNSELHYSVFLFVAGFFRSPKAFLNLFAGTLKIISDYYPGRLHKAFVIDPPSLFSCLWKGVRPFIDLSAVTAVVSSLDFEDSLEDAALASHPRTTSLRFHPSAAAAAAAKVAGSTSSRFSVTVSHLNSLKPWYLSTTTTSSVVVPTASPSLIGASPLSARSFSFASPAARSTPRVGISAGAAITRSIPSTPSSAAPTRPPPQQQHPRTPMPSFLQSPATLFSFKKERQLSRVDRERESFLPFLRFYRRPYDETAYRAKMRPPHGGLVSIVSLHDQPNKRRNKIQSFPFPSSQHRH
ncbi:SEC14 cytosolic factor family protein [Musa troglodytarum]|uniref:SEC14 cytosolic factor family protein n=1 Tax=Musa troglodytarum TaxID=320322 RepID=A0A9E7K2A8_9LILI|nr:SEC14 cytosolic factor family protein [Musa troglodytarum]